MFAGQQEVDSGSQFRALIRVGDQLPASALGDLVNVCDGSSVLGRQDVHTIVHLLAPRPAVRVVEHHVV